MTIRRRIINMFILLVVGLMVVSNVISWLGTRDNLRHSLSLESQRITEEVQEILNLLIDEYRLLNLPFDIDTTHSFDNIFSAKAAPLYDQNILIQITTLKGKILVHSPNMGEQKLPLVKGEKRILTLNLPEQGSTDIYYHNALLRSGAKPIATVQIGVLMSETENILRKSLLYRIFASIIAIFVALFLGDYLSRFALDPIVKMTRQVQSMAGQYPLQKLNVQNMPNDETGHLAGTFNRLLERISESFERQQQFVSDASHELRSPLTSIRGHAQLLQKRGLNNPTLLQEGLDVIVRESERLSRLIEDLLLLARSREYSPQLESVNITQLMQQISAELSPLHPTLITEGISEKIVVLAYTDSIKRVFLNLVDNALRASGPQGNTKVEWHLEPPWIKISVSDNGPGIPEKHLSHIFERFYRVDSARDRNQGGSGLGLAIVRDIVEMYKGHIELNSQEGVGTTFTVYLPIAQNKALQKSNI